MGYDLTWADDPYEADREGLMTAILGAMPEARTRNTDGVNAITSALYRALEGYGGYFRTAQSLMRSFIAEMEAQELFDGNEAMKEKLERQNGTITPEELDRFFDCLGWPVSPLKPEAPVIVTEFDRAMEAAALERGLGLAGGAAAMMMLHPLVWAKRWGDWLCFLSEARDHGGVVVG